jgi:hypothetical protein
MDCRRCWPVSGRGLTWRSNTSVRGVLESLASGRPSAAARRRWCPRERGGGVVGGQGWALYISRDGGGEGGHVCKD